MAVLLGRLPFLRFINCVPCQWIAVAGFLVPGIYRWVAEHDESVSGGQGVLLGLFTGMIAAVLDTGVMALGMGDGQSIDIPVRVARVMQGLTEAPGIADQRPLVLMVLGIVFVTVYPLISAMGGLVGAAVFGRAQAAHVAG